ncbi:hypothetical protein HYH03_005392 [Edaphochlamys debaryana]|uniref:Uncharacterized protein n=1 Tax=Edaphochlamys debaryana TaxID=47281 RepID=A0A836C1B3_9CHLO|nr:hypothetical protein HYH03_005392 [Edaphochlamys debaryana]|eukprot:KAG2496570.1 hypothetical protein HYH03_005392 [Edaphochlamys debaryana]
MLFSAEQLEATQKEGGLPVAVLAEKPELGVGFGQGLQLSRISPELLLLQHPPPPAAAAAAAAAAGAPAQGAGSAAEALAPTTRAGAAPVAIVSDPAQAAAAAGAAVSSAANAPAALKGVVATGLAPVHACAAVAAAATAAATIVAAAMGDKLTAAHVDALVAFAVRNSGAAGLEAPPVPPQLLRPANGAAIDTGGRHHLLMAPGPPPSVLGPRLPPPLPAGLLSGPTPVVGPDASSGADSKKEPAQSEASPGPCASSEADASLAAQPQSAARSQPHGTWHGTAAASLAGLLHLPPSGSGRGPVVAVSPKHPLFRQHLAASSASPFARTGSVSRPASGDQRGGPDPDGPRRAWSDPHAWHSPAADPHGCGDGGEGCSCRGSLVAEPCTDASAAASPAGGLGSVKGEEAHLLGLPPADPGRAGALSCGGVDSLWDGTRPAGGSQASPWSQEDLYAALERAGVPEDTLAELVPASGAPSTRRRAMLRRQLSPCRLLAFNAAALSPIAGNLSGGCTELDGRDSASGAGAAPMPLGAPEPRSSVGGLEEPGGAYTLCWLSPAAVLSPATRRKRAWPRGRAAGAEALVRGLHGTEGGVGPGSPMGSPTVVTASKRARLDAP